MNRLKQLEARAAALTAEMEGILAAAEETGGDLTEEQTGAYEAHEAEFAKVEAALTRERKLQDRQRSLDRTAVTTSEGEGEGGGSVRMVGERVMKDPKRGFASLGDFTSAAIQHFVSHETDERLKIVAAATGMSQGTGSDGGFTVPPEFSNMIWDGLNTSADSLIRFCDVYTVTGESLTFNANAETSRATGSRYGGVQTYWISEAAQITSSKPTFRQMKLEPQQIASLVYLTDKLLRNSQSSPALEQYVSRVCRDDMNFMIGDAIMNGNGVGKPTGFVGHASVVSVAKETGQPATTIAKDNIDKMWSRCHARARSGAVWFINQDCEPALEKLSAVVGTGGVPVYLPPGGVTESPNARLKGRPVVPVEYAATLGTVGDISLANLGYYAVGIQGSFESAMSMHLRFDYAETALRFMWAVDGQPWLASAITPFKGSNTQSPIVTLATRS